MGYITKNIFEIVKIRFNNNINITNCCVDIDTQAYSIHTKQDFERKFKHQTQDKWLFNFSKLFYLSAAKYENEEEKYLLMESLTEYDINIQKLNPIGIDCITYVYILGSVLFRESETLEYSVRYLKFIFIGNAYCLVSAQIMIDGLRHFELK